MPKLSERLLNVLDDFEKEIRSNEEILKVRLELFQLFEKKVTQLLKRDDITNDEKIKTLKNYFNINDNTRLGTTRSIK